MERDDRDMPRYQRGVKQIKEREPAMRAKSDEELRAVTGGLRARLMPHPHQTKRKPLLSIVPRQDDDHE